MPVASPIRMLARTGATSCLMVVLCCAATAGAQELPVSAGTSANAVPTGAPAEAKPAGELDRILAALETELDSYSRTVPSFLCNEHIVSEMEPAPTPGGSLRTTTDSVFRVRRGVMPDGGPTLRESRTLVTVNGKPAAAGVVPVDAGDNTTGRIGPMEVIGIFSNGLNVVSEFGKECFAYRLRTSHKGRAGEKLEIDFQSLPTARDQDCPSNGTMSGHAVLQPSSMRIVRLETETRDHQSDNGMVETWTWTIDYAPVTLGGKVFWLPTRIRSKAVPHGEAAGSAVSPMTSRRGTSSLGSASARPVTFTLEAKYTDYHLLNVTSRIVPVTGASQEGTSAPETPAH